MDMLIIRFGAMGDLLHIKPLLDDIRRHTPKSRIHVLTMPYFESFVSAFSSVQRVWTFDKTKGFREWLRVCRALQSVPFETVIDLHPSFKTWLLRQFFLRPKHVGIYRKQTFRSRGLSLRRQPRLHAIENFYQTGQQACLLPELPLSSLIPRLDLSPGGCDSSHPYKIALIPGVHPKRGNRAWPLSHYQHLIKLLPTDYQIVIIGGTQEITLGEALATHPNVTSHCGQHTLLETAELLASCAVVIGADTGPTHLAAAVGCHVISLFGPTDARRTGPLGNIDILSPPESLSCWPCDQKRCPLPAPDTHACMISHTPEYVAQRLMTTMRAMDMGCCSSHDGLTSLDA